MRFKILVYTLLLFLCTSMAMAQYALQIVKEENGKYYFKNKNNQSITLERKYSDVYEYHWGYVVLIKEKNGLTNYSGKEIIAPQYKSPDFEVYGSFIKIKEYNDTLWKWKLLDTTGNEVSFAKKYDNIYFFYHAPLLIAVLNGKTAFIDTRGNEITPFYDAIGRNKEELHMPRERIFMGSKIKDYLCVNFSRGIAPVKLNNKWGFIDTSGKQVSPLKYDSIVVRAFFERSVHKVILNGNWIYVNTAMQEISQYDSAAIYSEGLTSVLKKTKWGFIDTKGKERIDCKYDEVGYFSQGLVAAKQNGKWGFINKKGKEVISFKYDKTDPIFYKGFAKAELNGKQGFIRTSGEEHIKYENTGSQFMNGVLSVKLDGKWCFIDTLGREIMPAKYDTIGSFENDLSLAKLNNKWGYINKKGKEVIPVKFDMCDKEDAFVKTILDGKYDCYDFRGNKISKDKYDEIKVFTINEYNPKNLSKVRINNKYGLIDEKGKLISEIKYDRYESGFREYDAFKFLYNGYSIVMADGKYGLIDVNGKEVLATKYDAVINFVDGYAVVGLNKKYGFVDETGKEITSIKYLNTNFFHEGFAFVSLDNQKWGFIDKTGKEITAFKYDGESIFNEGLAVVRLKDKYAYIDKTGIEVTPFKYLSAASFYEGLAAVSIDNKKWGFIDQSGKLLIEFKYDQINNFEEGKAKVVLGEREFFIDKNGNELK